MSIINNYFLKTDVLPIPVLNTIPCLYFPTFPHSPSTIAAVLL